MEDIDGFDAKGERARLFPVLADSSKEGRTLSIVLATLAQVPEFAASVLNAINRRHGTRTKVECFTEVTFAKRGGEKLRPDGLIVVSTGRTKWSAFVEAKIGNAALRQDQIEAYLRLAKDVGVDAVITMTNDFAPLPEHHPLDVDRRLLRKVSLLHFSWFSMLTTINLLALNDDVADADHAYLLRELERFLIHPSAGLRRFDSMGTEWTDVLDRLRAGTNLPKNSPEVLGVVASWHSELRDLCLLLARKTGASADLKLSPKHRSDPRDRIQFDADLLSRSKLLRGTILVPDAAAAIEIEADLSTRTIRTSMKLEAPKDKAQQKSRVNWLLRQLKDCEADKVTVMANWPGTAPQTTSTVAAARDDDRIHAHSNRAIVPGSFVVMKLMTDGRRFAGRKTFIESLEQLVVDDFYGDVAQRLTAWRAPPPKLRSAVEDTDDGEDT
ncbi:hypothetical protein [Maricaulis maris]|uniref:Stress response protein n=1 Tax=Maricaulis maris TaxID=74318 RepID=A0A495D4V5_9PROT|nr:hypothetical protein [Maricaulis maris]RKQ95591.1 hypothetical protein C7435_2694 [Maricaulis maris]